MKFSYKFSNLLGAFYRGGNVLFTPDGNSIISSVGNRLTIHDLKNNKTRTLSLESRYNYTTIALSPDGSILIAANERGVAQLISMVSLCVVYAYKFNTAVQKILFSPDGVYFAIAKENLVFLFRSPGELTGNYGSFQLERTILGGYEEITWMDWSSDSRFLAISGRDNLTKICAIRFMKNFRTYNLSGHTDSIVGCFFEKDSLHINTVSRNGQLCIWECSLGFSNIYEDSDDLQSELNKSKKIKKEKKKVDDYSDDEIENAIEKDEIDSKKNNLETDENELKDESMAQSHPFFYKKLARHYLAEEPRKEQRDAFCKAVDYNKKTRIMVIAFSNGSFYLYELPDVNMIHSLTISDYAISTAVFNFTGDWVALASRELGQLLVWEWQSEQYIMKQQGHTSDMTCMSYSPDGQFVATGGDDAKVKLWNTESGFCFVTFKEHTSAVSGVQFSKNKKFLVSSSFDGTVRAFDIIRYRNFRTFTSPRTVQFACVAIDYSGELVVAGGQDVFEIYLWSMKLGKLLEVINGHEGPVCSIAFSPTATSSLLISGSWDKSIKIWNCIEKNSAHETIDLMSDVVAVGFNPNGEHIAVATINGNITVFDIKTATQISSIEGRRDLFPGRAETDLITAKKNLEGKYFTSIEYSVDGQCIIAGGKSHVICIYHAKEAMLLKKFEITQNHSLDGLHEYIDRRYLSDFGNMALFEDRENLEVNKVGIRLPGVQKGDVGVRKIKPEMKVFSVKFSPTGQCFATACTEGLCIFSLDNGVVFDPFDLSLEVTPKSIKDSLKIKEYSKAIIMSLKLNEINFINFVLEQIPYSNIELICSTLPNAYANNLIRMLALLFQNTTHLEFYLHWGVCLLKTHGNVDNLFQHHSLLTFHERISRKYEMLSKICDFNKYTMKALIDASANHKTDNISENAFIDDDI